MKKPSGCKIYKEVKNEGKGNLVAEPNSVIGGLQKGGKAEVAGQERKNWNCLRGQFRIKPGAADPKFIKVS